MEQATKDRDGTISVDPVAGRCAAKPVAAVQPQGRSRHPVGKGGRGLPISLEALHSWSRNRMVRMDKVYNTSDQDAPGRAVISSWLQEKGSVVGGISGRLSSLVTILSLFVLSMNQRFGARYERVSGLERHRNLTQICIYRRPDRDHP